MRKRIDFVATLFKEAADCLSALPSLYLQPVISFVQLIVFYAFWLLVVVCLATASKLVIWKAIFIKGRSMQVVIFQLESSFFYIFNSLGSILNHNNIAQNKSYL